MTTNTLNEISKSHSLGVVEPYPEFAKGCEHCIWMGCHCHNYMYEFEKTKDSDNFLDAELRQILDEEGRVIFAFGSSDTAKHHERKEKENWR